jgi:hypothetical protein
MVSIIGPRGGDSPDAFNDCDRVAAFGLFGFAHVVSPPANAGGTAVVRPPIPLANTRIRFTA